LITIARNSCHEFVFLVLGLAQQTESVILTIQAV